MKVGIVTDSLSNLPEDIAKKYDINIVNGSVYVDNQRYISGTEISTKEILEVIKTKTIKTAVPAPGDYYTLYEKLLDQNDLIISIHSPKAVTGFIESAKAGAKRTKSPEKIIHFESGVATIGLGLVAIATAILAPKITDEAVLTSNIKELCDKIEVLGLVNSFEYLKKSGRIKLQMEGRLASILKIRPILAMKRTKIITLEKPRNRTRAIKKLEQYFQKRFDPKSELKMIGMSQLECIDEADGIKSIIENEHPDYSILYTDVEPMIACNTGPGLLLVAYFADTDFGFKK